ncbi:MAG TPA: prephenate dehydrogenase/arogenate dehydrogenase family protein [Acidimicrobiales bacterium]|nr:prephenate dehydrogenase/arogenate dehydrogenase family protein [Acidimicrobiales bacterium]
MTSPSSPGPTKALVVGTGLMGASIGMALKARGWHVTGRDTDPRRAERALELGALDAVDEGGQGDQALAVEITFVATPVSTIPTEARAALASGGLVTDVGSVKGPIVASVGSPRFVGGHPMAGSEQEGVDGADGELFEGATWVLTPTDDTDPEAFARVRTVISSLGADVVAIAPERHDELVAVVSHVPHLAAATLMGIAAEGAAEHAAMLRLAAGGFRDMTRIAAGHPGIWPDICAENRTAIVAALDRFVDALGEVRHVVQAGDRARLLEVLEGARAARTNLPARAPRPEDLAEVRVPVPDRPGAAAQVLTLAAELGINVVDMETAHSVEGDRGVLVLVVGVQAADHLRQALVERGFRPSVQPLG